MDSLELLTGLFILGHVILLVLCLILGAMFGSLSKHDETDTFASCLKNFFGFFLPLEIVYWLLLGFSIGPLWGPLS